MKQAIAAILFFAAEVVVAQSSMDTTYHVEITASPGPIISFFRHPRVPGKMNTAAFGYGMYVRGMWQPGKLLSLGLMTGYLSIADDEIPLDPTLINQSQVNPSAHLTMIPLQLAISMHKYSVEVGIGVGPYLLVSTIRDGAGESVSGSRIEYGMTFFGTYYFHPSPDILIGPEFRILYLGYRGILSWMPSCSFRINVARY